MTGAELKRERRRRRFTQAELAKRLDIGARTLRRFEIRPDPVPRLLELALRSVKAKAKGR
jgi:transcriptional regulator with XRE-family HTH domain